MLDQWVLELEDDLFERLTLMAAEIGVPAEVLVEFAQYEEEVDRQYLPESWHRGLVLPGMAPLRARRLASLVPHSTAGHRITPVGLEVLRLLRKKA
jgi:hypothetical protein